MLLKLKQKLGIKIHISKLLKYPNSIIYYKNPEHEEEFVSIVCGPNGELEDELIDNNKSKKVKLKKIEKYPNYIIFYCKLVN